MEDFTVHVRIASWVPESRRWIGIVLVELGAILGTVEFARDRQPTARA